MISTRQEQTLAGKPAFERLASTFGIKIKIYHADNGNIYEQPFRSAIEDANQTITFFWVGSHHQNASVERKKQTLTLGARTMILHAKMYWPEKITTMLCNYVLKFFVEQLNVLKVDDDGITPMERFSGTTTDINLKNNHT